MIIKRIHSVQISITNTAEIYTSDPKTTYMAVLKEMYVGKIFKRMFVKNIEDLKIGQIIINPDRAGGDLLVTVSCTLVGIQYDKYEVLTNAKVVQIVNNNIIILGTEEASIGLMIDSGLQFLKIGDTIPILISDIGYTPYREKMAISAIPFVPIPVNDTPKHVVIPPEVTAMPELLAAKKRYDALDSKLVGAYAKHFSRTKKPTKLNPKTTVDFFSLLKKVGKKFTISRSTDIPMCESVVTEHTDKSTAEIDPVANQQYIESIARTLIKEYNSMVSLIETLEKNPLKDKIIKLYASHRW